MHRCYHILSAGRARCGQRMRSFHFPPAQCGTYPRPAGGSLAGSCPLTLALHFPREVPKWDHTFWYHRKLVGGADDADPFGKGRT